VKKWRWLSGFAVLLLMCALAGWFRRSEVSIRIRDHRLSIYEARIWHCDPTATPGWVNTQQGYPILRWLDYWRCYYMRQIGIKHWQHLSPTVGWVPDNQTNRSQDVLLLFGSYPEDVGPLKYNGFDVVRTNGVDCGLGNGSVNVVYEGIYHSSWGTLRAVAVNTNFGTANYVETNMHGLFWLRLHGRTNVLAEIRIR
jgi:hypothetical protein